MRAEAQGLLGSRARRVRRSTAAREVEVHLPLPTGLLVRRNELPLSGRLAGNASEIVARSGVIETVINHAARRINRDTHRDLHVAMNSGERAVWHVGYLFVDYGGG